MDALRRHLLAVVAAAFLLALAPSSATAATEQARTADSFVDSIGVNTHTYYTDSVYHQRFDEVEQRLAELGVRHIRENLVPDRPDQYQGLRELAGIGIGSDLILGDPEGGASALDELTSIVRTELGGAVDAVEGPNELDMSGDPNWVSDLRDYQQRLYGAIKGDPALASLPVIGPSIVQRQNQEALGDISGQLDFGNIHSYPNGESPELNLGSQLERAAHNSGSKPVMATETGYHNALASDSEHNPTSEAAAATYIPRMFLEYFRKGVARTYSYELVDRKPDPSDSDLEAHFGLLRNDLSEKPAFTALRNTISIVADPGPDFAPEALDYTLGGDRGDLHQVLLQKRDGSFYLALWRSRSVWNPTAHTPIDAKASPLTVSVARGLESAQRYAPNSSAEPLATLPVRAGHALTVSVGAQVVILRLELGGSAPRGRIKLWVSKHSVSAGGRVAVRGQLPELAVGRSLPVKIQRWHGGWRTVGRSHTSRTGVFKKKIRVPAAASARASRLRVVARKAKPSKAVRLRIRS